MASGWKLWVWLECIGVVSGCCYKEVYKYPHNNYYFSLYTPLVLALFLAAASLLLCSFKNMFFHSCTYIYIHVHKADNAALCIIIICI